MDTTRWKSVAVKVEDHAVLKALCEKKFRAPAAMISKLVYDYLETQAKRENTTVDKYKKRKFCNLLSLFTPLIWSSTKVKGLLCHSGSILHMQHV